MSSLRKLKNPYFWLTIYFIFVIVIIIDSFRITENQISAKLYIGAVRKYQIFIRPISNKIIVCIYKPSCSEYSIQVVKKYGIRKGLFLSLKRLFSCRRSRLKYNK